MGNGGIGCPSWVEQFWVLVFCEISGLRFGSVCNSVIGVCMYVHCDLGDVGIFAYKLFDEMPEREAVYLVE